jgi:FKBP-type peptidyl-prolyl cis-trans isomerase FkpA
MRKILFLLFLTGALSFFSCFKKDTGCGFQSDTTIAPATEQKALKSYLDSVGISATLHSGGFYYVIVNPGSGTVPGPCSRVTVTYTGQLINGSVFEQETDGLFTLGGLLPGWKQGLPLISKGGEIKLYVPPTLGFGTMPQYNNSGALVVPANSILIFDINLVNVQ